MLKRTFVLLLVLLIGSLATILLAACGSGGAPVSGPQVHMDDNSFLRSAITIHKGERVTLTADTLTSHVIANGTWKDGNAQVAREAGAPVLNNVSVGGYSSVAIGPFPQAGTFKLYCTVHPGMNLTVIVQ